LLSNIKFKSQNLNLLYNLGDFLCSPSLYFNFQSNAPYTIIGGGAYNLTKLKDNENTDNSILWSVGVSSKNLSNLKKIKDISFLSWSLRDRDRLDNINRFVPCVSCFNKLVISPPVSDKTFIFLNKNPMVSTTTVFDEEENKLFITNDCSVDKFLEKWNQCDKVITNSYHGIYWSLLSGKEVMPFGYSSKFISVFEIFDLVFPYENLYDVNNPLMLDSLIKNTNRYYRLSNHNSYLETFKDLNIKFANSLLQYNILVTEK